MKTPIVGLFLFVTSAGLHAQNNLNIQAIEAQTNSRTLADLLALPPEKLGQVDIAEMQLLCLQDPAGKKIDFSKMLAKVSQLAEEAKKQAISKNAGTAGEKAMALISSLRGNSVPGVPLLILYLSAGRRLGYPVKFAVAENGSMAIHWDDKTDNFAIDLRETEIEQIGRIPKPSVPPRQHNYYFLKPPDEFALLLAQRGEALERQGFNSDALVAYTQAYLLSPGCQNFLVNIKTVSPKVTRFFGHTSPKAAQDYSQRPDQVAQANKAAEQMTALAMAEAKEVGEVHKQYPNDPSGRTKAVNAVRIKYAKLRTDAIAQQNQTLVQDQLKRQEEINRSGY